LASGAGPAAGFCAQAGAYLGGKLDDALSAHQRGYEQQKKQMAAQDAAGYALYAGQHELHHSLNKTMLAIRSETGLSITDIAGRLIRKLLPISNRRPDAAYVGGRPMIAPQYPWYAPALVGNYLKMVRGQYQVNKPAMDAMFADMHSWARKLENAAVAVVLDGESVHVDHRADGWSERTGGRGGAGRGRSWWRARLLRLPALRRVKAA
jgi:hypothetical protein